MIAAGKEAISFNAVTAGVSTTLQGRPYTQEKSVNTRAPNTRAREREGGKEGGGKKGGGKEGGGKERGRKGDKPYYPRFKIYFVLPSIND